LLIPLTVSAILVAYNWLMYVLCVTVGEIVQASLGYYILPLVSVALGVVIFRERLRPMQILAIGFAAAGVGSLTWAAGVLPALGLAVALSFSVYGLLRRRVPVDGLVGLTIETFVLAPVALAYLVAVYWQRGEIDDADMMLKYSVSGVVTAVPLLCFGQAARLLPFAMLGFMQYISPTVQFLLALWLFDEKVQGRWLDYGLVWIALAVFSIDSYLWYRRREVVI
jgi:chloramphenicol-sensitive protein RarD